MEEPGQHLYNGGGLLSAPAATGTTARGVFSTKLEILTQHLHNGGFHWASLQRRGSFTWSF